MGKNITRKKWKGATLSIYHLPSDIEAFGKNIKWKRGYSLRFIYHFKLVHLGRRNKGSLDSDRAGAFDRTAAGAEMAQLAAAMFTNKFRTGLCTLHPVHRKNT